MPVIWLRYQNTGAAVERRLNALAVFPGSEHAGESGISGRGIRYNHRLASWHQWRVTIGTDELIDPAARAFVEAWYDGATRWASLNAAPIAPPVAAEDEFAGEPTTHFILVDVERSGLPMEFLEGNKHLPQFSVTVLSKYPKPWS